MVAVKSFIVGLFVSLFYYSSLTAGVAISSSPAMGIPLPNDTSLADDRDTRHCSSDRASYGQIRPHSFACILALDQLLNSPQITTLQYLSPMNFLSSTAPRPPEGEGFQTPWRSTYGESMIQRSAFIKYRFTDLYWATGLCTVAVALLSDVPARFTPEASATPSGESAIVIKGSLERAGINLGICFTPPGTNIGWAEVGKCMLFSSAASKPVLLDTREILRILTQVRNA